MIANATGQLPLFGDVENSHVPPTLDEDLSHITWSYSRRSMLEQCPRRYYYEYFAANKRLAKADPMKEEVHLLKSVQNRHLRMGTILHLVIGTYLRKAQQGEIRSGESLVGWARKIFAADRAYSRRYMNSGSTTHAEKYDPTLLGEYLSGDPRADALCDETEESLVAAIRSFTEYDQYADFRAAGSARDALIEHRFRLSAFPCRVTGKVDLSYQYAGRVTVVDWKSGSGDGSGDDSLQLAAYALWAVEQYSCLPETLRVCKVHLASDEIIDFPVDADVLAAARARVIQDAERMGAMEGYGKDATVAAFTPCAHLRVCQLCPFRNVCPEGRELVNA